MVNTFSLIWSCHHVTLCRFLMPMNALLGNVWKTYDCSATTRVVDSHDIRDQLSVLFQREAVEDLKKMQDYYRLSGELSETIRMRDAYIIELHTKCGSNEFVESIKILRHMQLDDTQAASRLMLMAREMRDKVNEKNHFVARLRLM
ncbi:hypothetical protein Tco_1036630 [Tanacetum coccineum]